VHLLSGVLFALEWALRLPPPSLKKGKETELSQAQAQSQPASRTPARTQVLPISASASVETAGVEDAWISDADRAALLDAAAEVLIIVVDHHVAGVRSHIVKQFEIEKAREHATAMSAGGAGIGRGPMTNGVLGGLKGSGGLGGRKKPEIGSLVPNLLKALLDRLGGTKDVPFRNQIGDSLRMLLELPNMDAHNTNGPEVCSSSVVVSFSTFLSLWYNLVREEHCADPPVFPARSMAPGKKTAMMLRLREDPINEHFFPFFYDHCITIMFKPLLEVPEWKKFTGEYMMSSPKPLRDL
jgi:hypothetical protein